MDSNFPSTGPVFKTCGVQIPLNEVEHSPTANIVHTFPKDYNHFATLRRESEQCDVVIKVGDKKITGHKALLAYRIPFFRALFDSKMSKCPSGEMDLSSSFYEFDMDAIESLLDYAYTGCLTIYTTSVQHLMKAAVYLQIETIVGECAAFMRKRTKIDNVLPLFIFLREIAYDKLDTFIMKYFDKNFVPISHTSDFLQLSIDDLSAFLQRDSLYVDDEKQVFEAVTRWIEEDVSRLEHAVRLLKCVRFTRLSETFIENILEQSDWVKGNEECKELIGEVKKFIRDEEMRSEVVPFTATERSCEDAHHLIFSIGNCYSRDEKVTMELYDPIRNKWTECEEQTKPFGFKGFAVVNGRDYFFGRVGVNPGAYNIFDSVVNEWHPIYYWDRRSRMAIGIIDGRLVVAGGVDKTSLVHTELLTTEVYNPLTWAWSECESLSKHRESPASCVFEGKLYVIGGRAFTLPNGAYYNSGLSYHPEIWRDGEWSAIPQMMHARCEAAAAVLNGHIYVVGGYSLVRIDGIRRRHYLNSAERFDPTTNRWTAIRSMKGRRGNHSLVVSCGKLFVVGGSILNEETAETEAITTVEMYDPELEEWVERAPMTQTAGNFFIGVLPVPASFPSPKFEDAKGI